MRTKPNVLIILNDDMGYSDIGCYGGEVDTPHLDRLAAGGLRFSQFYNTARCSPSRASLLTGLHPHQTGIGVLVNNDGPGGYPGNLHRHCATVAELLQGNGYRTYMAGKWHVANDVEHCNETWPKQRGFDRFYGTLNGSGSYYSPKTLTRDNENIEHEAEAQADFYYTDAISDQAAAFIREHAEAYPDRPFLQYVAYTAPHWPLHAKEADIAKYKGRFDCGWDILRTERVERMTHIGLLQPHWPLTERDAEQPAWEDEEHQAWRLRAMETYAAQIDCMDQGIGRIMAALEQSGQLEHTLILFLSDNGGCAEVMKEKSGNKGSKFAAVTKNGEPVQRGNRPDVWPGAENTFQSYGVAWANLSNTPFRLYKHWVHEGGIATPFIVHWPQGIGEEQRGQLRHTPCQLTDVLPTILELTGTARPRTFCGDALPPLEGESIVPLFAQDRPRVGPLFWEHEGNAAIRIGRWKLVRKFPGGWELYDVEADRTETVNWAAELTERVTEMSGQYEAWAKRCGVIAREQILAVTGKL